MQIPVVCFLVGGRNKQGVKFCFCVIGAGLLIDIDFLHCYNDTKRKDAVTGSVSFSDRKTTFRQLRQEKGVCCGAQG